MRDVFPSLRGDRKESQIFFLVSAASEAAPIQNNQYAIVVYFGGSQQTLALDLEQEMEMVVAYLW